MADLSLESERDAVISEASPGPVMQSVAIAFLAIYAGVLLLALVWLGSNIREIAPDSQAVVLRFGRVVRAQESGLLMAWPRPIEEVRLLPGPDRQLNQAVAPLAAVEGIAAVSDQSASPDETVPPGAAPYLTGDGSAVLLDATLIYHITDPQAYVLSESHIAPALDRLFRAGAVQLTAGASLNDFLSSQTNAANTADDQAASTLRASLRDALLQALNVRLQQLAATGAGLGVEVDRIDMTAWLPPQAKPAFDAVLTATQEADQKIATARTDAELRRQGAEQERDRLLSAAEAAAKERIASSYSDTAIIRGIEKQETPSTHDVLLLQAYRAATAGILNRAGTVTLVDPSNAGQMILPGKHP